MNKQDIKELNDANESSQYPNENESLPPVEHETDKKGQRQGGIDKKGFKEKDEHGEL